MKLWPWLRGTVLTSRDDSIKPPGQESSHDAVHVAKERSSMQFQDQVKAKSLSYPQKMNQCFRYLFPQTYLHHSLFKTKRRFVGHDSSRMLIRGNVLSLQVKTTSVSFSISSLCDASRTFPLRLISTIDPCSRKALAIDSTGVLLSWAS